MKMKTHKKSWNGYTYIYQGKKHFLTYDEKYDWYDIWKMDGVCGVHAGTVSGVSEEEAIERVKRRDAGHII